MSKVVKTVSHQTVSHRRPKIPMPLSLWWKQHLAGDSLGIALFPTPVNLQKQDRSLTLVSHGFSMVTTNVYVEGEGVEKARLQWQVLSGGVNGTFLP